MHCVKQIQEDLYWVGGTDRRLALFENMYPIPRGVSYNSYLVMDEQTVLLDTVDRAVSDLFLENIAHVLDGQPLDYLIVNHMEPDHCAVIGELLLRYPALKVVGNAKTIAMIKQFYNFEVDSRAVIVKEGDTLSTGQHTFTFVMAPMVHWPEAMVTYDTTRKILYSADAFGTFGAMNGNLYADEVDFDRDWMDDARRYYTNIVGKYGPQVQALLKKAAGLEITMICPLHGPVWRTDIAKFVEKYDRWSSYRPEDAAVLIAYGSVYGHTENAANILAAKLADLGIRNIAMYDTSATHPSYILSEAFRCSHIVFASSTYNNGIFTSMETLLADLKAHNLQNRKFALIQNGTWAPASGKLMSELLAGFKGFEQIGETVTLKSAVKQEQYQALNTLAEQIAASVRESAV
ncbi:MAG: FprA family A-type flavoprotein [Clostridia bacterium]